MTDTILRRSEMAELNEYNKMVAAEAKTKATQSYNKLIEDSRHDGKWISLNNLVARCERLLRAHGDQVLCFRSNSAFVGIKYNKPKKLKHKDLDTGYVFVDRLPCGVCLPERFSLYKKGEGIYSPANKKPKFAKYDIKFKCCFFNATEKDLEMRRKILKKQTKEWLGTLHKITSQISEKHYMRSFIETCKKMVVKHGDLPIFIEANSDSFGTVNYNELEFQNEGVEAKKFTVKISNWREKNYGKNVNDLSEDVMLDTPEESAILMPERYAVCGDNTLYGRWSTPNDGARC